MSSIVTHVYFFLDLRQGPGSLKRLPGTPIFVLIKRDEPCDVAVSSRRPEGYYGIFTNVVMSCHVPGTGQ